MLLGLRGRTPRRSDSTHRRTTEDRADIGCETVRARLDRRNEADLSSTALGWEPVGREDSICDCTWVVGRFGAPGMSAGARTRDPRPEPLATG
jgi:hypothetical protein